MSVGVANPSLQGAQFFKITYHRASGAIGSTSWLSQCMRRWVDQKLALRAKRGEYFIFPALLDEVKKAAQIVGAELRVELASEAEKEQYRDIFLTWQRQFQNPPEVLEADLVPRVSLLSEKTPPSPRQYLDLDSTADWQVAFEGLRLYHNIFQVAMVDEKIQNGLFKALRKICDQENLGEEEVVQKMDAALQVLKNHAKRSQ